MGGGGCEEWGWGGGGKEGVSASPGSLNSSLLLSGPTPTLWLSADRIFYRGLKSQQEDMPSSHSNDRDHALTEACASGPPFPSAPLIVLLSAGTATSWCGSVRPSTWPPQWRELEPRSCFRAGPSVWSCWCALWWSLLRTVIQTHGDDLNFIS